MIKNCFITDSDFFNYEIAVDGEVIAKAHTLTFNDKQKCFKQTADGLDINYNQLVKSALDEWFLKDKSGKAVDLTMDNISKLTSKLFTAICVQIMDHENKVNAETEEIEKN